MNPPWAKIDQYHDHDIFQQVLKFNDINYEFWNTLYCKQNMYHVTNSESIIYTLTVIFAYMIQGDYKTNQINVF